MSPTRFLLPALAAVAIWAPAAAVQAQTPPAAAAAPMAKPLVAQGDMLDSLKLNGQFETFVQIIADLNFNQLIKTNKNLTVFAPTDAAFAAMPPADLAKLKADPLAMRSFVAHHIINLPWPSSKFKGVKGPIQSARQDNLLLDGAMQAGC